MSKKTIDGNIEPIGYEQINDLSSAQALTVPAGADIALIQARDQAVRWRDDGTNPTALIGMVIGDGLDIFYTGDLDAIRFFEVSAGAELNVSYYNV